MVKTLTVRFVNGPLDGQSRDIAYPPVKFEHGPELDADDNPIGWPNIYAYPPVTDWMDNPGHYEEDSHSEALGFAVFVWIPFTEVPGCMKPKDALELAARYESIEKRRFSSAVLGEDGKVRQSWTS